jgi:ribose transport system ATP-binding protein
MRLHVSDDMRLRVSDDMRLHVSGIAKSFGGAEVLSGLNMGVAAGEVHALVGENGSGKSTFIRVLAGYHKPDRGEVYVDGAKIHLGSPRESRLAGFRFVHQDLALVESLSILDNLSMGTGFPCLAGTIRPRAARRAAAGDLLRLGINHAPLTPLGELTAAERSGVAVARALRDSATGSCKVLVLDEPTATLPHNEVAKLMDIIRRVAASGVAVIYVSHRLDEIFDVADNVTVLRDGKKVADRAVSSLTRAELVNLLVGREFDQVRAHRPPIADDCSPSLVVRDLVAPSIGGVSFDARPGEILGFAGIVGSGRETLLSVLFGGVKRRGGEVTVAGRAIRSGHPHRAMAAGVALLPASRTTTGVFPRLSARENLTITDLRPFWRLGWLRRGAEKAAVREWFDRLAVRPATGQNRPLLTFSGGNQQKVLFARWMRRRPVVFLLDEPTQGVDVGGKAEIHAHIQQAAAGGTAVVVSSSDPDELAALCHRVLALQNGRIVAELAGSGLTVTALSRATLGATEGIPAT